MTEENDARKSLSILRPLERHPTPSTEIATTTNKLESIDIKQLRNSLGILKNEEVRKSLSKLWPPWKLRFAELVAQVLEEVLEDDY